MTDYRTLALALHELESPPVVRSTSRAYTSALAASDSEIGGAEAEVRAAGHARTAAHRRVDEVDVRAADLWRELSTLLDRDLGPVPDPYADDSPDDGVDPLERASERIGRAAIGEPVAPVPGWTTPALPPAGALAALVVSIPIRGMLALTGEKLFLLDLIGEIALFVAPFAGVPLLAAWTRRRFGARPDAGAMGLTALGGMIASCALVLVFR